MLTSTRKTCWRNDPQPWKKPSEKQIGNSGLYAGHCQSRGLQDGYDLVTDREKEVLQLLVEANRTTSANFSRNRAHRTHSMQELNIHSSA
jgi:hypothetical protein